MKKLSVLIVISILLFAQNVYPATTLVVNGLPIVKVMSDIEGTEFMNLSEDESFEYRLMITKKDGKYIWASRENKELLLNQSGLFFYFFNPTGAGYIKISKVKGKVFYMEHLTLGFKNITYWGIAKEFSIE